MLIDGKKYACDACIKGHRVSGCQHEDRELHYIAPKGRPIKQCEHCRQTRKTKNNHTRCDCGNHEKDKKDIKVDTNACCCHDGTALCICGIKKEGQDIVPQKQIPYLLKTKPRLTSTQSESTLTVFANGHHKPCHRNNNAAHTSGAPYKIPKLHTHHGSASMSHSPSGGSSYFNREKNGDAPRSADDMHLLQRSDNNVYSNFSLAQRSMDSLPFHAKNRSLNIANSPFGSMTSNSPIPPLSRNGSPAANLLDDGSFDSIPPPRWPELTIPPPTSTPFYADDLSTSPTNDYYTPTEGDFSMPSAGIEPSWSARDLPLDPSKLSQTILQSAGSNHGSGPGLTAASSGAQSEVGDPAFFGDAEIGQQNAMDTLLQWDDGTALNDEIRAMFSSIPQAPTSYPACQNTTTAGSTAGSMTTAGFNPAKHIQQPQNILVPSHNASTAFPIDMSTTSSPSVNDSPPAQSQSEGYSDANTVWRDYFPANDNSSTQSSSQISPMATFGSSANSAISQLSPTAPTFVPSFVKESSEAANWDFMLENPQAMSNDLTVPLQPLDIGTQETSYEQWFGQ